MAIMRRRTTAPTIERTIGRTGGSDESPDLTGVREREREREW